MKPTTRGQKVFGEVGRVGIVPAGRAEALPMGFDVTFESGRHLAITADAAAMVEGVELDGHLLVVEWYRGESGSDVTDPGGGGGGGGGGGLDPTFDSQVGEDPGQGLLNLGRGFGGQCPEDDQVPAELVPTEDPESWGG